MEVSVVITRGSKKRSHMFEWEFISIIISLMMTSIVFEAAVPKKRPSRGRTHNPDTMLGGREVRLVGEHLRHHLPPRHQHHQNQRQYHMEGRSEQRPPITLVITITTIIVLKSIIIVITVFVMVNPPQIARPKL